MNARSSQKPFDIAHANPWDSDPLEEGLRVLEGPPTPEPPMPVIRPGAAYTRLPIVSVPRPGYRREKVIAVVIVAVVLVALLAAWGWGS